MQHHYSYKTMLWGALLALGVRTTRAYAAPADSLVATSKPSHWLVKSGLRLTHLSYSHSSTGWRLLVPASLAVERRLGARFSLTAQLEPDVQLASVSAARRRRRSSVGADAGLFATSVALGGRYYYARPARAAYADFPEFGRYIALELGAETTPASTRLAGAGRFGTTTRGLAGNRQLLASSLYAMWGVQNRLRRHVLYDLNAGLGILAPTRTDAEYLPASHNWDVGAQVNIRLYVVN